MSKIIIYTDSTCDLNDLIVKRDVKVLPLKVCFGENTYKDQVELTTEKMFEKVEETGSLPTTAAASITEFIDLFNNEVGQEGNDIIYCGISSKLSSSYQNAVIAKNELDENVAAHVHILDSGNLSTGIGLVILKMCDMRDAGYSVEKITEEANKIIPCVRAQFAVKNLEYLHKGGRCSGTTKVIGTLLRIRPILRVFDGSILLSEKIFGIRYEKALDFQINDIVKNINDVDLDYLFVTHSQADEEAKYILNNLPSTVTSKFKNIYETKAGSVISAHCGKGTIGILYIKKQPLVDDK